jgi:hypothetical protein
MKKITVYDTTLCDGMQGEGVNFSLQDKLDIARRLDGLGVDFLEAGYPVSNPKDEQVFQELKRYPLKHAAAPRHAARPPQPASGRPLHPLSWCGAIGGPNRIDFGPAVSTIPSVTAGGCSLGASSPRRRPAPR